MKRVGFDGGKGENPVTTFFAIVEVKFVRITDERELYSREFGYKSGQLSIADWNSNDAQKLREELILCSRNLSKEMVQELFLLSKFSMDRADDLCRVLPMFEGNPYNDWNGIRFIEVDSLRPTLKWESFPKAKDKKKDNARQLIRIRDVTYELKIWRAEDSPQGGPEYIRTGLPNSSHKVERPLMSLTRYFWSVRVRFQLDGHPIETKWTPCCPFYTPM